MKLFHSLGHAGGLNLVFELDSWTPRAAKENVSLFDTL